LHAEHRVIEEEQRTLVERLLLEKISLHGICRAVGVSLRWRMDCMVARFAAAPEDLQGQLPSRPREVIVRCVEAEADELHSFGQNKANEPWLWLAMDRPTRQVIACHVGDRSRTRAKQLWANLPAVSREQATFYMLSRNAPYHELGADYFDERRRHSTVDQLARRIEHLGYRVHLEPVTAPAA
jgi:IS1 family transposase